MEHRLGIKNAQRKGPIAATGTGKHFRPADGPASSAKEGGPGGLAAKLSPAGKRGAAHAACGLGHAGAGVLGGRRALACAAACLLIVLAQVLGCFSPFLAAAEAHAATLPDVIHATTDKDAFAGSSMPGLTGDIHNLGGTNPLTGGSYTSYATAWRTQEGLMGYCVSTLNNHQTPADGVFLTYRKNRLMDPELAYILRHGYPFTNTISGVTFSDADARLVTQFAFWLITDEDFGADRGNAWKTGVAVPAARALVDAARAHGAEEAKKNQFWVYSTDDGDNYQDLVLGCESTGGLRIRKSSSDASVSAGNLCYDLAGAVYGVYEDEACTKEAARMTTDSQGRAEVGELLSGGYWVREISPAKGFALDGSVHAVEVPAGDVAVLDVSDAPQRNPIEVAVGKLDAQTGKASALGAATLEGATFSIDFYAGDYELGNLPDKPDATYPVTTGANGTARLDRMLALGTVVVREVKAPRGYVLNAEPALVHITSEGQGVEVHTYNAPQVADEVVRADLKFVKADEDSQRRMANVAFRLTSHTTGESHILVTDENGAFDSAEAPHSRRTNANDAAVRQDGSVDASKLDPAAGVWFSGHNGDADAADDARGALPYDTYELEELRCEANEGHRLVCASLTVSRDGRVYELGTFDDRGVAIGTTLAYGDGEKCVPAAAGVKLVDAVGYENLERGHEYRLEGELHLVGEDGSDAGVVASSGCVFTPGLQAGSQDVVFELDTSELAGRRLVAFERLYDADDLLAAHEDLGDEGQTVSVPQIATTLAGSAGHEADASQDTIRLVDSVAYTGLEPGREYRVSGTLHVRDAKGADAGELLGTDGNPVEAEALFTPQSADGTVEVTFEFSNPGLAGQTVVAFESLERGGITYAVHADISDEGQSVRFPAVRTEAAGSATGDHDLPCAEGQKIIDSVWASNLEPGASYTLVGSVHARNEDGSDGGVVAQAATEFCAEGADEIAEVEFEVDASELGGRTLVVFEELLRGGARVAAHEDLFDEGQSVKVPAIGTTLSGTDGQKEIVVEPGEDGGAPIELVDRVSYSNLVPKKTYTITGTLHVPGVDEAVATAEAEFTPETANGEAEVRFSFDAAPWAGKKIVAFESLSSEGVELAVHADLTDEAQTVELVPPAEQPPAEQPPAKQPPAGRLPRTGDVALPAAAAAVVGGIVAFVAWAIVHAGNLGIEDREHR